jgi:hypothetical protein
MPRFGMSEMQLTAALERLCLRVAGSGEEIEMMKSQSTERFGDGQNWVATIT